MISGRRVALVRARADSLTRPLLVSSLAVAILVIFGILWGLRGPHDRVRGDEGTYLAMTESLARDGDLWFGHEDQTRLEADGRPGRKAVILQRVGERVAYSKPILFPLLATPFYGLLGENGLIVFNALSLAAALGLLALYFRRMWPLAEVWPTVVAFAGLGLLLPYVPWRTSDTLQAALAIAGLSLCLWDLRPSIDGEATEGTQKVRRMRLLVGGALLGALISLRLTNGLIAVIPVLALWVDGRRRRATLVALAIAGAVGLGAGTTWILAGEPSPYLAVRATFNPETGYPENTGLVGLQSPFDYDRASYDRTKKIFEAPLASVYSALYFVAGRHTGVLLYFPLAAFLVVSALRRPDRTTWVVILAVAGLGVFYLAFLPFNYFGGATCIGNRYFLVSYAALPFALRRPLGGRTLTAAWTVGLVVAASALMSVTATHDRSPSTQNHAYAGVFRWMPFESTVAGIDGSRDIFWRKELGRFVDPYVRVSPSSFRLASGDRATQLQVANRRRQDRLRFLVLSSAPRLDFVYSDWGQRIVVPLESPVGERGLVEIQPSRPLRVHPLWFRNIWDHGLPYYIRDFKLAIRSPDGQPAAADVRYLGVEPWPREVFEREVLELALPRRADAGTTGEIVARVRNRSRGAWEPSGVFPVSLSYRLEAEPAPGRVVEGPRVSIGGQVGPGADVHAVVPVTWPGEPGRYRLTVDLLIEGVAWFEARVGRPLAETVVEVVSAPRSGEDPVETTR